MLSFVVTATLMAGVLMGFVIILIPLIEDDDDLPPRDDNEEF